MGRRLCRRSSLRTARQPFPFMETSRICTLIPLVSSSSAGPREMQASQAARSSSTPTAVGVPTVVKRGLAKRALVQLSYAIGVAKPLSLFVETYGTEQGKLSADDITNVIKIAFDCRPGAIAQSLSLREPKYQETAAYCHF